ncbi:AEC family transporter [Belliella marina]|uniref:AEC family transporter n=1 Tax=Belliella marina TaxID=1644146 RepID=A0ABW4VL76_9BACT
MSVALQKTLSLILLIILGLFLKRKFTTADQNKGIKTIILDIALPAMIFVALLKIEINPDLLILPILALVFNILMLLFTRYAMLVFGIESNTATMRTLMLLIPSLAPGLTCFPFIVEYLGDDVLAWAALSDMGNKVFVLIAAYMLAMSWFYKNHRLKSRSNTQKVKELLVSMIKEPINMVIISAIILLGIGVNLESMPVFVSDAILMMKNMMTPLVLLFIGIAVVFKWQQLRMITALLVFRAGFVFILSGLFVLLVPLPNEAAVLLAVVFPQSAVSFWPFAHMSAVRSLELKNKDLEKKPTFDLELGINILAVSMPFSTLLVLGIFTSDSYFTNPYHVLLFGAIMLSMAVVPKVIQWLKSTDIGLDSLNEKQLDDSTVE